MINVLMVFAAFDQLAESRFNGETGQVSVLKLELPTSARLQVRVEGFVLPRLRWGAIDKYPVLTSEKALMRFLRLVDYYYYYYFCSGCTADLPFEEKSFCPVSSL